MCPMCTDSVPPCTRCRLRFECARGDRCSAVVCVAHVQLCALSRVSSSSFLHVFCPSVLPLPPAPPVWRLAAVLGCARGSPGGGAGAAGGQGGQGGARKGVCRDVLEPLTDGGSQDLAACSARWLLSPPSLPLVAHAAQCPLPLRKPVQDGLTPMLVSSQCGQLEVTKLLVKAGANKEAKDKVSPRRCRLSCGPGAMSPQGARWSDTGCVRFTRFMWMRVRLQR
jgi:hypothetical protein